MRMKRRKMAIFAAFLSGFTALSAECGDLPQLKITADFDLKNLTKEDWVSGEIEMDNSQNFGFPKAKFRFKGRGNSTWRDCAKKSFSVKFDEAQSVFGSAAAKNFVLLANYLDLSFLKNDIAFYIARRLGFEFVPKGDFVRLFFNGDDKGLYYFCEKIEAGEGRVALGEGGVLLEIDHYFDEKWKFNATKTNAPYMVKSDAEMTEERLAEIKAQIDEIENIVYNDMSTDYNLENFVDLESFAKCFVVQIALMRNFDFAAPNSFFCRLQNGKLDVPAVWDFDFSFGGLAAADCIYFDRMRKSDKFKKAVAWVYRASELSKSEVLDYVRSQAERIECAARRDGEIWEAHAPVFIRRGEVFSKFTFENEVANVQKNLAENFDAFEAHLRKGEIE